MSRLGMNVGQGYSYSYTVQMFVDIRSFSISSEISGSNRKFVPYIAAETASTVPRRL